MEARKLLKDKKFWFASFLIAWAAALQVGTQKNPRFVDIVRSIMWLKIIQVRILVLLDEVVQLFVVLGIIVGSK